MKVKFLFNLISNFKLQNSNKISTSSRNKEELKKNNKFTFKKNNIINPNISNEIFEYNLHSIDLLANLTIASLKYSFSISKKINPDSIQIYKINNRDNLYEELIDSMKLSNLINKGIDCIYELYYTICKDIAKITVDFYQMNIDKIFIKLSSICTIQMLKMIINEKLNNSLIIDSLRIYGLYIIDVNSKEKKIMNQSKEINDKMTLKNIINSYFNNKSSSQYMIYFLLSRNKDNKLQMGLNFKFNYLKNISKISFNQNAPTYCECSDGINLFAYCRNTNCQLFNNLFIKVLGYGIFDIMREIERVECPNCKYQKTEVKNIGFINSKWYYKGKINSSKQNSFEGDGITIDDQLYIFKEAKISSLLLKLIIEVKPHIIEKDFYTELLSNDSEDVALCDQSIKEKQSSNEGKNILSQLKDNNVRYYETESEIRSMDVEIDKPEKVTCHSCEESCILF
jgi:hypothetical protein